MTLYHKTSHKGEISTNIPVLLMTGFVFQGHTCLSYFCKAVLKHCVLWKCCSDEFDLTVCCVFAVGLSVHALYQATVLSMIDRCGGWLLLGMSRRSRNSRAWRYVWSGIRRDADARALVLASENDEWGYDRQQVGVDDVERPVDVAVIKGIQFTQIRRFAENVRTLKPSKM